MKKLIFILCMVFAMQAQSAAYTAEQVKPFVDASQFGGDFNNFVRHWKGIKGDDIAGAIAAAKQSFDAAQAAAAAPVVPDAVPVAPAPTHAAGNEGLPLVLRRVGAVPPSGADATAEAAQKTVAATPVVQGTGSHSGGTVVDADSTGLRPEGGLRSVRGRAGSTARALHFGAAGDAAGPGAGTAAGSSGKEEAAVTSLEAQNKIFADAFTMYRSAEAGDKSGIRPHRDQTSVTLKRIPNGVLGDIWSFLDEPHGTEKADHTTPEGQNELYRQAFASWRSKTMRRPLSRTNSVKLTDVPYDVLVKIWMFVNPSHLDETFSHKGSNRNMFLIRTAASEKTRFTWDGGQGKFIVDTRGLR